MGWSPNLSGTCCGTLGKVTSLGLSPQWKNGETVMTSYSLIRLLRGLKKNLEEYDQLIVKASLWKVRIARRYNSKGNSSKKISYTIKLKLPWSGMGHLGNNKCLVCTGGFGNPGCGQQGLAFQECCMEISGGDLGVGFLGWIHWSSDLAVTVSTAWEFFLWR